MWVIDGRLSRPSLTACVHGSASVTEGSELWLLNTVPVQKREILLSDSGNKDHLSTRNLLIKHAVGNPTRRADLLRIQGLDEFGGWTGETVRALTHVCRMDGLSSFV